MAASQAREDVLQITASPAACLDDKWLLPTLPPSLSSGQEDKTLDKPKRDDRDVICNSTYHLKLSCIVAGQEDKALDKLKRDDRDVICVAWLLQCEREGRLVPLRPRHYLHMSRASLVGDGWLGGAAAGANTRVDHADGLKRNLGCTCRCLCASLPMLIGALTCQLAVDANKCAAGGQPRCGQPGRLVHERCAVF